MKIRCRGYEGILVYLDGNVSYMYANSEKYDYSVIYNRIEIDTMKDDAVIGLSCVYPSEIEVLEGIL